MVSWKLIQKARKRLEQERGFIQKSWGGRISICLIYPNSYYVGMSNLGFQSIYQRFNEEEDVVCERAFLPEPEDLLEYQKPGNTLFSLESQKPLSDFDVLAFSISFENDFLNVLTILQLAHLPLERKSRKEGHPLVLGGGVALFLNPEPLCDFFDLFILGEAEEVLGEFLKIFRSYRDRRETLLRQLSFIEGIYVPQFYHVTYQEDGRIHEIIPEPGLPGKIKRRWIYDLNRFRTQSVLFTPETEFNEMALIELNRGCPRGCRFCAACFVYHPFRNRSLPTLKTLSKEALAQKKRIGLTGTAVSDYPHLLSLCEEILAQQGGLSFASLRVDTISPSLVQSLREGGGQSAAIAPEAGTERLRKIIKKGYRDEEIVKAIEILIQNGLSQIKAYFLIGLPFETEEDVKGILLLSKKIQHHLLSHLKEQKKGWRLNLHVTPFVPKPHTPFQWVPFEEMGALKRKLRILKKGLQGEKQIGVLHDLPKWSYLQAFLSRGDRRVGRVLMAAHHLQGNWTEAFRLTHLNPDFYVYRKRDLDEIFPWDFIDHGISKEKLKEEYLEAMKEAGVKPKR